MSDEENTPDENAYENTQLVQMTADNLAGDLAGFLIDHLRHMECAYRYLNEDDQKDVIRKAKRAAHSTIEQVVKVIAAKGFDTIPVILGKAENNGKIIKVVMEASITDEHAPLLLMAAGQPAKLTIADDEEFKGGDEPQPDPDQKQMFPDAKPGESGLDEAA